MTAHVSTDQDLDRIAGSGAKTLYRDGLKIAIGSASCGIGAGARDVEAAAVEAVKRLGLDAAVPFSQEGLHLQFHTAYRHVVATP